MKKILIFLLLLFPLISFSQYYDMDEVVYLKNGSIIRGIIIEQVPNKGIKIQTKDENIFYFSYDEIEKITKEPKVRTKNKKSKIRYKEHEESDDEVKPAKVLSLSYGIGLYFKNVTSAYSGLPDYKSSNIGPISLNFEKQGKKFSGGANISYSRLDASWTTKESYYSKPLPTKYVMEAVQILGRFGYHFSVANPKYDPYVCVGVGYTYYSQRWSYAKDKSKLNVGVPIGYVFNLGSRYYFNERFGVQLEAGIGLSFISGGLAYRF